jgi:hypothetical protein
VSAAYQLELVPPPEREPTPAERFEAFDRENPRVWEKFEEYAFEAVAAGCTRIGAKMIWERLRWFTTVETTGAKFRFDNSWTAHYARKWCREHPSHAGLFELREGCR